MNNGNCPDTLNSCNLHYATSSWTPGGTLLLLVIIVAVILLLRRA